MPLPQSLWFSRFRVGLTICISKLIQMVLGPYLENHSVQFSCSVVSDSLWPHGLQHARPPCPSPAPGVYSNSCPSSRWCHPTISSSVIPFSCLQSFPASGSFPMSQFFASCGQSVGELLAYCKAHLPQTFKTQAEMRSLRRRARALHIMSTQKTPSITWFFFGTLVDLQCHANLCCTTKWLSCTHVHILLKYFFPFDLLNLTASPRAPPGGDRGRTRSHRGAILTSGLGAPPGGQMGHGNLAELTPSP